jgi:60 kDa SS-A/Ro ribonucleoprotein
MTKFVKMITGRDVLISESQSFKESIARVMLCGILKDQFYSSKETARDEAVVLFKKAAVDCPDFLLKSAIVARNSHMKGMVLTAISALVGMADKKFIADHKDDIFNVLSTFAPNQLLQFVEITKSKTFGNGLGSAIQKIVAKCMFCWDYNTLEIYTIKYKKTIRDLVRLVHPSFTDERGKLIYYVLDNCDKEIVGEKQKALEFLIKSSNDICDEQFASIVKDNNIPWDALKGFYSKYNSGPVGKVVLKQMGLNALLLNLNSFDKNNIFSDKFNLKILEDKLNNTSKNRFIPLDFAKPYYHCDNDDVKNILIQAMESSLNTPIEGIKGKRIGLSIDVSGSMGGESLVQAGLLAIPFLKCDNLWFTLFDTRIYEEGEEDGGGRYVCKCPKITNQPYREAIKSLLNLKTGGGTDVSISIKAAINKEIKMDLMVLLTDEQQNAGSPVVSSWKEYREKINPNAKLWIINASNYTFSLDSKDTDNSIITYQTVTSDIFRNLQYLDTSLVSFIENY